jgi:hypothetical protein
MSNNFFNYIALSSIRLLNFFIKHPKWLFHLSRWRNFFKFTLLPSFLPNSFVNHPIFTVVFSHSMHFIMQELALISISILPYNWSYSTLLIMKPISFISTFANPTIFPFAIYLIIRKISFIITSIKIK